MKHLRLTSLIVIIISLTAITVVAPAAVIPETHKLLRPGGADGDQFGFSVAVHGSRAVVGANNANDLLGAAYLFDTRTGAVITEFVREGAPLGEFFGCAAAMDDTTCVIGAEDLDRSAGSAYVFDLPSGRQRFQLTADDGEVADQFGFSVAMSGNLAVIGAPVADGVENSTGAVYVFDLTTGRQLVKLTADDGDGVDAFGFVVAIDGTTVLVGAPYADFGAAYLFDAVSGRQIGKFVPQGPAVGDHFFGSAVAIAGSTAVVGMSGFAGAGNGSGAVFVFDTVTGEQTDQLLPADNEALDAFGYLIAMCGHRAVIGARDDDDLGESSGSAYVFDVGTGAELAKLTASDGAPFDLFGLFVDIDGTTAIVGAIGDSDAGLRSGSAYLFEVCPGNVGSTLDEQVDTADLMSVLACWGSDAPDCRGADLNHDGRIGFDDVLELLSHWGPCA